jgi:hypothetical protein
MLLALTAMELNFDEFKWGGLHKKHAEEQSQHLLNDRRNPQKKTCVEMASRRNFRMHTGF